MVTFRVLLHGRASSDGSSPVLEPGLFIARTAEVWAWYWEQMTNGQHPRPEIPSVDWSGEVVVVMILGRRPTTGYAVTIDHIVVDDQALEVSVTETKPAGAAGRMVTRPVHAVAMPAQDARDNLRLIQRVISQALPTQVRTPRR